MTGRAVVATHHIECEAFFEQAPNPDSRIILSNEHDTIGQRKVSLDWRLTPLDFRTYRATAEIFRAELERLKLGDAKIAASSLPDAEIMPKLAGAAHHLGTTRMSDDARKGVVDRDCKVHGIDNLYVSGGSIFPTGGWAWPTFTMVALGLRLADRVQQRLMS